MHAYVHRNTLNYMCDLETIFRLKDHICVYYIKTHDNELQGQEEVQQRDH